MGEEEPTEGRGRIREISGEQRIPTDIKFIKKEQKKKNEYSQKRSSAKIHEHY